MRGWEETCPINLMRDEIQMRGPAAFDAHRGLKSRKHCGICN